LTASAGRPADRELVVLLDEDGRPIGTAAKASVHTAHTPLHRAFSCYLFSPAGQLLLTRRAQVKRTFAGMWTNSVCGHPAPGESDGEAIRRRTRQELQLTVDQLAPALPDFRYRATSHQPDGELILENEICPVYLARTTGQPHPDPTETDACSWVDWVEFLRRLAAQPEAFSPWSALQAEQLERAGVVQRYLTGQS
jgi:isopentenyl-diphosphate delta-isomerase